MQTSIETGLVIHHEMLKNILINLATSSLQMEKKEFDSITLDESFKNIFILLFIGTSSSFITFVWEILQFLYLARKQ